MNELIKWDKTFAGYVGAVVRRLRRDWDMPGIMAALADERMLAHDAATSAQAAIRWAANPAAQKPIGMCLPGPHWPEDEPHAVSLKPQPPRETERCPEHPGYPAGNCGACRVDRYGDDEPSYVPADTDWRKALAEAKDAKVEADKARREAIEAATEAAK